MELSSPTFKIGNSTTQVIPAVGFGCWKVSKDIAPSLLETAIANGYRHIDSAADYGKNRCLKPDYHFILYNVITN